MSTTPIDTESISAQIARLHRENEAFRDEVDRLRASPARQVEAENEFAALKRNEITDLRAQVAQLTAERNNTISRDAFNAVLAELKAERAAREATFTATRDACAEMVCNHIHVQPYSGSNYYCQVAARIRALTLADIGTTPATTPKETK